MKVAIIGKAPSSRLLAPYDDDSFQIWSLSDNYTVLPRWDRWFELHDLDRYREMYPQYYDWLCEQPSGGKPIYLTHPRDEVPAGVKFDYEAITKQFGTYFTNSISWMTALALMEMPEDTAGCAIHYYGVDMAQDSEYAHQRPSCEYFLGIARGRGIDIHVPAESDLLKTNRLYAIETNRGEMDAKLRAREMELKERQAKHEKEREEAERAAYAASGAIMELEELAKNFSNGNGKPKWISDREVVLQNEITKARHVRDDLTKQIYMILGARENIQWSRQWA